MAKTTKYEAVKTIVNLNGKNYEVGESVTGLTSDQEQRLTELGAIEQSSDKEDKE